ncbi:MAG: type II/IV secretion system protein [Kiritimatiellae bacterium]|nr:type II/IV secretion system protein [Kiritimatiellia bacterium]
MRTAFLDRVDELNDPIQLADRILRAALFLHASDIHLDPMENHLRVRFRIDGELEDVLEIKSSMQNALASRLKVLSSLDIAERRAPQDGGFTWRLPGSSMANTPLDVRMATLPVRHGERITLRLLETGGKRLTLDDLGMSVKDRALFDSVLRRPHGLVLLTGPTGSGKTTTLYAAIQALLKTGPKNIVTVEDPIEYEIPGVAQAEVDSADKVNFSKALKSLLRHDPDVVMIGEIRDADSLNVAIKAALTGHLVLSTLHTNDAKGAVTRLVDMGLDPKLIGAVLRLAVAQRLVRRICTSCNGKGCSSCSNRGYSGRIGIFEFYSPDGENLRTMRDDAMEKVQEGVTSLAEIEKALGE